MHMSPECSCVELYQQGEPLADQSQYSGKDPISRGHYCSQVYFRRFLSDALRRNTLNTWYTGWQIFKYEWVYCRWMIARPSSILNTVKHQLYFMHDFNSDSSTVYTIKPITLGFSAFTAFLPSSTKIGFCMLPYISLQSRFLNSSHSVRMRISLISFVAKCVSQTIFTCFTVMRLIGRR